MFINDFIFYFVTVAHLYHVNICVTGYREANIVSDLYQHVVVVGLFVCYMLARFKGSKFVAEIVEVE